MVHYSNSSLGGALKSPGKNGPFALTACIRIYDEEVPTQAIAQQGP